jgi:oligosaccharyl transferase (archaeosortase A-associated)
MELSAKELNQMKLSRQCTSPGITRGHIQTAKLKTNRKEGDKKVAAPADEKQKGESLNDTDFYWHAGILLAVLVSFYLRGIIPIKNVFVSGTVYFSSDGDAWYHMMLTKGVVINLQRLWFDPMTYFPHGTSVPYGPFNDWAMAIISLLLGLGHPGMHTIDAVGAFFPAVLGALVVIPVYLLGRAIGGKPSGLISAFIIAVLPGGFLERTMLGFADHDAAELLLSTLTMMFFMMAMRTGRGLTFKSIQENWSVSRRPLMYVLLAGVSLGLYLDAWQEGFLFEGIIIAFVAVQSIVNYLMGREMEYLIVSSSITLGIATLMIFPFVKLYNGFSNFYYSLFQPTILVLGIIFMLIILFASIFLRGFNRYIFPLVVIGVIVLGALAISAILPQFTSFLFSGLGIFSPKTGGATTVGEVSPFLYPGGQFSLDGVQGNFPGISVILSPFFLAIVALALIFIRYVRNQKPTYLLIIVWSLIMLFLTLAQNRFADYYAVDVALLNGYLAAAVLNVAGLFSLDEASAAARGQAGFAPKIKIAAAVLAAFLLLIYPGLSYSVLTVGYPVGIEPDWLTSTGWLQNNTPSPGLDLYRIYEFPLEGRYPYPAQAYGIMSWWDYGDYIEAIGHRIPNSNPFQEGIGSATTGVPGSSPFFLAENESQSEKVLAKIDENRSPYLNTRYVMIDWEMATGKFYAMTAWSAIPVTRYFGIFYEPESDQLVPIELYRDHFFETMTARLFFFDGSETPVTNAVAIAYEIIEQNGTRLPVIVEQPLISGNYSDLQEYVNKSESNGYLSEIVSEDTSTNMSTSVPLTALKHYRLVHESESTVTSDGQKYVKIFENVPGAVIRGEAAAGTKVSIAVPIKTNQNREFVYRQSNMTSKGGNFTLIVPYSTEGPATWSTRFDTGPIGPYQLKVGDKEYSVKVPEETVMTGGIITI